MSSVECLKDFINERLTAAAEEIFRVIQKTIVKYEEELHCQRTLLDIVWKPTITLHSAELPQQHVCKEEVLADQQLCNQERNYSLDQDNPEPPQIKEEQEEICTSLEVEQLVLKQETETLTLTPTCEESNNSEDPTLNLSHDETQSAAEKEHVVSMSVKSPVEPKPNSDDQLLSQNTHVAEKQDHKGDKHGDSQSARNAEPKPQKKQSKSHSYNVFKPTMSKIQLYTHTGKKILRCDTCGKAFKYISLLNRHMRTHTGEKPYPCNICKKRFSGMHTLKVHMRIHTGEKPYTCDTCEKRFSHLGTLRKHISIHSGKKPYTCNTCEKRFSVLDVLRVHMRTHSGEKPYICNTCERRFSELRRLRKHMQIHTGEKPYQCNTCKKSYFQMDTLKVHMRTHAGDKL